MSLPARLLPVLVATLVAAGCASAPPGQRAVANVKAVYGQVPSGNVEFLQQGPDTVIYANFLGWPDNLQMAFHVHEKGECVPPTLESSGPIFDPVGGKPHGPLDRDHKMGDMPNLVADHEGRVVARYLIPGMKVSELIGRSVIIHRGPDDYRTQPEGNSGDRVGCGIIQAR